MTLIPDPPTAAPHFDLLLFVYPQSLLDSGFPLGNNKAWQGVSVEVASHAGAWKQQGERSTNKVGGWSRLPVRRQTEAKEEVVRLVPGATMGHVGMLLALVAVAVATVAGIAEEAHKQPSETHNAPTQTQNNEHTDQGHDLSMDLQQAPIPASAPAHATREAPDRQQHTRQQLTEQREKGEEGLMTEKYRHKQQLTGVKQKQEQVARQRHMRWREGRSKELTEKVEEKTLIVSENQDGLAVGNVTMLVLGLFALAVGAVALAFEFLPGTPNISRVGYEYTAHGVRVPSFEEVAAVVAVVDRKAEEYERY
ncbi:uncharacterized protein LOC135102988 [Scylla paramamosain]|uniref:uncharacterized protein LOC135102988 n=1 Tax=Scylla paramamosain TaxID=85552 RepID=UPI003082D20A